MDMSVHRINLWALFSCPKGGKMSRKKTILPRAKIDGRKYLEEQPEACDYCYWWEFGKKECILPECYYLMSEAKRVSTNQEEGNCKNCAYGKHSPCIGYCIAKILKESREKRKLVSECRKK